MGKPQIIRQATAEETARQLARRVVRLEEALQIIANGRDKDAAEIAKRALGVKNGRA